MASSADIPCYMRTSFLTSNYHRWTGHILLWNTNSRCHHYCSILSRASKWRSTLKHLGNWKVSFQVSQLTHSQIFNISGKSRGNVHTENRGGKQALGKEVLPFISSAERWVRGCLLLPTDRPSRTQPSQQSKSHSDLPQPKAICQLAQVSYKAAQENKSA